MHGNVSFDLQNWSFQVGLIGYQIVDALTTTVRDLQTFLHQFELEQDHLANNRLVDISTTITKPYAHGLATALWQMAIGYHFVQWPSASFKLPLLFFIGFMQGFLNGKFFRYNSSRNHRLDQDQAWPRRTFVAASWGEWLMTITSYGFLHEYLTSMSGFTLVSSVWMFGGGAIGIAAERTATYLYDCVISYLHHA